MRLFLIWLLTCLPLYATAQERLVRLHAPAALVDTGLLNYILPRFKLKTQVKVELVDDPAVAEVILGPDGQALFEGAGAVWHLQVIAQTDWTDRFAGWLTSDVGQNTIFAYAPDGAAPFTAPGPKAVVAVTVAPDGDADLGRKVSRSHCARCHAVDEATRKTTIGSTPSFFVLRSLADWEARFTAFYVLNPHPSFTQIADVTAPFRIDRPSPIVPIELTLEELEAVVAYVAALTAADLGPALEHQ